MFTGYHRLFGFASFFSFFFLLLFYIRHCVQCFGGWDCIEYTRFVYLVRRGLPVSREWVAKRRKSIIIQGMLRLRLFSFITFKFISQALFNNLKECLLVLVGYAILTSGNQRAKRRLTLHPRRGYPPDERKEGLPMITYQDLFLFCTFIVSLIGLLYQIFKGKK